MPPPALSPPQKAVHSSDRDLLGGLTKSGFVALLCISLSPTPLKDMGMGCRDDWEQCEIHLGSEWEGGLGWELRRCLSYAAAGRARLLPAGAADACPPAPTFLSCHPRPLPPPPAEDDANHVTALARVMCGEEGDVYDQLVAEFDASPTLMW